MMEKITSLQNLYKHMQKVETVFIYVRAFWCNDCLFTELNFDLQNLNLKEPIYQIEYNDFIIFCDEYKITKLPTIACFKNLECVNKLGDGNALNPELIIKFIKHYQGE